ncbi:MAG: NADH-quinone oxidoreductase subunit J [Gemmatimonadetes bacterium]|nr:NADH-quinone oxidoreductase subunit J [Gemmatimonadota bacterium]
MAEVFFYLLAALAIGGGVGMVTRKNPVGSLLFLVLTLASLAGIFVLLDAHFLAAIQVVVYAGAIMVLFLFVIMLLNLGHDYQPDIRGGLWMVMGFALSGLLGGILAQRFGGGGELTGALLPVAGGPGAVRALVEEHNAVGAIAGPMFRDYLVPFEVTSVLLLVAIVGAIVLAKRRI